AVGLPVLVRGTQGRRRREPRLLDVEGLEPEARPPGLVAGGPDVGEVLGDGVEPCLGGDPARRERVDGPVHTTTSSKRGASRARRARPTPDGGGAPRPAGSALRVISCPPARGRSRGRP